MKKKFIKINKTGQIRLLTTLLKSGSLKRVAQGLSKKLGYTVFRSGVSKPNRKEFRYGDQKGKIEQYSFFQNSGINALDFTINAAEANTWLDQGHTVVARKLTHSSEGKGIIICEPGEPVCPAPVYTKYKKKKKEFRVHIFKDQVVQVLEKRRKSGYEGTADTKIRNTANGYVFCNGDVVEPDGLRDLALSASKVTNSDFRGVDIGWNEKKNELFVIEVNSAPGIEGSNVGKYVQTILQQITQ